MAQPSTQQLLDAGHATEYFWYAQGTGIFDARNNAMLTKSGSAGMAVEGGANVALGDGATHYLLPSSINIAQPWTIIFRVRSGAVATTDTMVCGDTATSSDFVRLMLDTSQVRILAAGSQVSWTPQTITALTTWAMVSSGTTVTLYKDGVAQGAAQTISGTAPIKINRLMDGYPGGTFRLKGALEFVNVVPSALDATSIAARSSDPYAVLVSAGGGAASATFAVTTADAAFSGGAEVVGAPATATFAVTTADTVFSGGASVAASGSFVSDVLINNTGTVLASQSVHWSWLPSGRIGSLAAVTEVDGTGTTSAGGVLTVTGLTPGAGILLVAKRNTSATDDAVYYHAGTVV